LPNDPYWRHRAKQTKFITGVEMDVTYMVEDFPRSDPLDSEALDKSTTVTFRYDLELDASGLIIGGEWHTPLHPDFIWLPAPGVRPSSVGDILIKRDENDSWTGRSPIPPSWQGPALKASRFGQPLRIIVDRLIDLAND
ncbi:peptidase, partial [bacterium]|nr:peptidase [bacterium]